MPSRQLGLNGLRLNGLRLNGLGLSWLAWIWLAGVAAMALRTAARVLRADRVVHRAQVVDHPRAARAMTQARERLSLDPSRTPELRASRRTPVPFAWRGRRPAVVLPAGWRRWDDERLTVVLIHELAHLGRRDALALWIGRAAAAVWWFHPLVYALERWARRECERAADDAVLLSGSRASDYAEHLIAISRALTRPFPAGVALTMTHSPDLKHRLIAILTAGRPRRALDPRLASGAACAALALAVTLAGARLAPAHAQDPDVDVEVDEIEIEIDGDHDRRHRDHRQRDHRHDWHHDDHDSDHDSRAGRADWKRAYDAHREGRYDEAVAGFEAAAAAGYRPAVAVYNAACGLSLSGRADEALATLRRAIDLGLDDPELIAEDSDLDPLRADDRFQALVDEAFERAGERRDPSEHYRYRDAFDALEALRETGSEDAGAWAEAGTRLLTLRQLDEAAEALENAARFARETPAIALYNLACAYALAGRTADALDALERSIEAGYSDPEHIRRDGDLASLRGDADFERLVDLAADLDLDRFRRPTWRGKGRDSRYSAETWAPAIEHFRTLVDERPELGVAWFNLGYALHYSERFDESVDAFERARQLGHRPATAAYNVACGYAMQDRVEDALAALETAIDLGFHRDLDHDSDLDSLRDDPRFRDLRQRVRLERRG